MADSILYQAYKTELDPNNKQRTYLARCCGTSRWVYNWALAEWKKEYEAGGKPSAYGLRKRFNAQKDEICPWVRDMPYAVTESAFANLGLAFEHFFRRVKKGKKPGYPKFKKRGVKNSFQIKNLGISPDRVRITGIGWVKLKEKEYIPAEAQKYGVYATVSERAGRWFISVMAERPISAPVMDLGQPIGIDVGIKYLAVCSDGKVFDNPKALDIYEKRLKRLQRELSRRKKGSQNRAKTKQKIARCYAKINATRQYALHEVSHYVTDKNPCKIVVEDLNISGMMKNHHIARAMSDAALSELRRQIEYKAGWKGIEVVAANRYYPSSKTCSECGAVKSILKLSERVYSCENCGAVVDRDLNAALNLAAIVKGETHPDCLGS